MRSSACLLAALLLTPASALAQDRVMSSVPATGESTKLMLSLETGGFGASHDKGNAFLGGSALADVGPLRFGLRGEASTDLFSSESTVVGGLLVGAGTQVGRWRLDLLGHLGVQHTWGIPQSTFLGLGGDGNAKVTLPMAGGRLGVSYAFQSRAVFGLWGFADQYLATKTVDQTTNVIFANVPTTDRFGGTRYGVLLSFGVQFDLSGTAPSQVASR